MKERPIPFLSPMVRAILDGSKTQTRRVMSPQPDHLQHHEWRGKLVYEGEHRMWCWKTHTFDNLIDEYICESARLELSCMSPYGIVGDRLWVKETIRRITPGGPGCSMFAANDEPTVIDTWPWKRDVLPAIFTPRGASRITLEITEVRVQRLQEISDDDAQAEGVDARCLHEPDEPPECSVGWRNPDGFARDNFRDLWDSINGKRAPWASNPFVWAISFKRVP